MVKAILALITAAAIAIPTLWAWKVLADKKRKAKDLEKQKKTIEDAAFRGDTATLSSIRDNLLQR